MLQVATVVQMPACSSYFSLLLLNFHHSFQPQRWSVLGKEIPAHIVGAAEKEVTHKVLVVPTGSTSPLNISAVPLNRSLQDICILPEDVEKVRTTRTIVVMFFPFL